MEGVRETQGFARLKRREFRVGVIKTPKEKAHLAWENL